MPAEPVQEAFVTEEPAAAGAAPLAVAAPPAADPAPPRPSAAPPAAEAGQELVRDDLLVEDVSIDGMCGVY